MNTTTNTHTPHIEAIDEIDRTIYHVEHVLLIAVDGREYEVTVENRDGDYSVIDAEPRWSAGDDVNYLEEIDEELTQAEDIEALFDLPSHYIDAELMRFC